MESILQGSSKSKAPRRKVRPPYDPLSVKCPQCGSYIGLPCRSSNGTVLRYPHRRRQEAAAETFRSAFRLQLLVSARRSPFVPAFSPRRTATSQKIFMLKIRGRQVGHVSP